MAKIKVNGVNIYYELVGKGPFLALLHGWVENHKFWKNQVPFFSEKYRILTIDHRGFGDSDKPEGEYSIALFADDFNKVLEKLKIDKITVMGHSMGGMIGQVFALKNPKKIKALTLVDTSPSGDLKGSIPLPDGLKMIQEGDYASLVDLTLNPPYFFADGTDEKIVNWVKEEAKKTPKSSAIKGLEAMINYNIEDQISQIKVPTLIITGDQDQTVNPSRSEVMAKKIAGSKLFVMKGCGHHPLLEKPEELNKIVDEFLQKIR
jgi:3-oxoadipate enol-lactonase